MIFVIDITSHPKFSNPWSQRNKISNMKKIHKSVSSDIENEKVMTLTLQQILLIKN